MINTVEVYHNPYRIETKILVNGKPASAYSSLSRFYNEPFEKWCTSLCEQIALELNDEYELFFCSGEYETDIMRRISADCSYCRKYRILKPQLCLPEAKRLSLLSRFIKKNKIQNFRRTKIQVDCVLYPSCTCLAEQIRSLEIQNVFCQTIFHIRGTGQPSGAIQGLSLVFAVPEEKDQAIRQFADYEQTGFLLLAGERKRFLEKRGGIFVYEFVKEEPEQMVFDVMLMGPLRQAFYDCKASLPSNVSQKPECRILDAMEPELEAGPPCQVEMGYKIPLKYSIYPPEADLPLEFAVDDPDIAECSSRQIIGKKDGDTCVRIYHAKMRNELASIPVHVFRTNHINSVVLKEKNITLPEGGRTRLEYRFFPEDADNICQLFWSSSDPEHISVDRQGIVRGTFPGKYRVRLQAGTVSDECTVLVKERLKGLCLSPERMELTKGEWGSVICTGEPKDCYPETIYTYIENKTIISYAENTVYAEQAGETDLVFYNADRSIVKRCHIVVKEKTTEKVEKDSAGVTGIVRGVWSALTSGNKI